MTLTMTCEQFEKLLPALLDEDTAGSAMTPAVRLHADSCVACRALLDELDAIRAGAASLPILAPSRDLWSGVAARIEAPVVPLVEGMQVVRPRRTVTWRSVGIAAAVLVVANVAVAYRVIRRGDTPTESPEIVAAGAGVETNHTPGPAIDPNERWKRV